MGNQKNTKPLLAFLSHASEDKPKVRNLCKRLKEDGFDPWLDEERLLPGQDWNLEIEKALRASDAILLCFSNISVKKEGYIQREYKRAKSLQEEKPEGTIYTIPVRLDDCEVPFSFREWQWVDYPDGYDQLRQALQVRAGGKPVSEKPEKKKTAKKGKPAGTRKSGGGTVFSVQGGIHAGGSFINGDQYNYHNQTMYNISSPAEFVSELQKLRDEIERLKSQADIEPSAARRLAAAEDNVQEAMDEAGKEKPVAERINTTLKGAQETMQNLGGSITAALGLGTTLGNLALVALKLFGK